MINPSLKQPKAGHSGTGNRIGRLLELGSKWASSRDNLRNRPTDQLLTSPEQLFVTVVYMSPEQAMGDE
jgi:hypothetical protein